MVAYLKKPTGSDGFQEIVDFLNGSHIRYALTKNPTIYVSLIKKFWQTATIKTVDNGEQEIIATVDGKEFTFTEVSVRRHLQLADADGMLAIQAEEGEEDTQLPQTSVPIPNVADEAVFKEWDDRVVRATTTAASLDAAHASGNITKTQSTAKPNVPLPQGIGAGGSPRVNTLGSDEGSMSLQELTVLCTKLFNKVESLETDLKQTKQVYGAAYTKLIMKVKKLEKLSRRMIEEIDQDARITLVTPTKDSSQEDQPKDQLGVFSVAKVLVDAAKNVHTYTRKRRAVCTGSGGVSTTSRLFSTAEE
ncbi:hypothetical protein Tco_0746470 [Tanacetum coccineum]